MTKEEAMQALGQKFLDLLEKDRHTLSVPEAANVIISLTMGMLLECAPSQISAIQAYLWCTNNGLQAYVEAQQQNAEKSDDQNGHSSVTKDVC